MKQAMTLSDVQVLLTQLGEHAASGRLRTVTLTIAPVDADTFDVAYEVSITAKGGTSAMLVVRTQTQVERAYDKRDEHNRNADRMACLGAATIPVNGGAMQECVVCETQTASDLVDHSFIGFRATCEKWKSEK